MDIDEHQSQTDDAVLKLLGQRRKRRQQRWPGPRVSTGRDASIHLRQRNPVGESEIERGHPFRRKTAPGDPFQASDEHFSDARREEPAGARVWPRIDNGYMQCIHRDRHVFEIAKEVLRWQAAFKPPMESDVPMHAPVEVLERPLFERGWRQYFQLTSRRSGSRE